MARRLRRLLPLLFLVAAGVAAAAPAAADADAAAASPEELLPLSAPPLKALRTLSGLPTATVATPSPPSSPPSPPPATGSWLPSCTTVNVGSGYDLIAAAAAAPLSAASSSAAPLGGGNSTSTSSAEAAAAERKEATLNQMTGAEFLASIGQSHSFSPLPRRLPITNLNETPQGGSSNDTIAGASVCSNDAAYTAGPTASPTVCEFINCYDVNNQRSCYICSGTFVGDPSGAGRLIFLTASHCSAENLNTPLSLASSYVTCNRASGATDGIFRATGAAISVIDFSRGYGITDGAFILVAPMSNTNLGYAARLAIGAIKSNYFSTSVPNYSGGFPQVDTRLEGCTSANLGNVAALHYSRRTAARSLVSTGIQIAGISGCGGNSGGPLVDESACVVYGVLSSTTVACSGGTNFNSWSRLITTGGGGGVNVPGLSAALSAGTVNFVS